MSGKEGMGRGGGICAIGFRGMDAPVQKHRLIAREIIFVVPPMYPPGPKSGGTMSPPHPPVAPPMANHSAIEHAPSAYRSNDKTPVIFISRIY